MHDGVVPLPSGIRQIVGVVDRQVVPLVRAERRPVPRVERTQNRDRGRIVVAHAVRTGIRVGRAELQTFDVAAIHLDLQRVVRALAEVRPHVDALEPAIGPQEVVGQRAAVPRIDVLGVLVDELRAVWDGIDVLLHLEISIRRADVAHVDDRAPTDVTLDAGRVAIGQRRRGVALETIHGRRPL